MQKVHRIPANGGHQQKDGSDLITPSTRIRQTDSALLIEEIPNSVEPQGVAKAFPATRPGRFDYRRKGPENQFFR